MSNELSPGDLAVIIESVVGANVGVIVQCSKLVGTHSLYGPVWRVSSKQTLSTEYGGVGNNADVPAKWLKKIKPPPLTDETEEQVDTILEKSNET